MALVLTDPLAADAAADEHMNAVSTATYILDAHTSWAEEILGLPPRLETELVNVRTEVNILYIEAAIMLEGSK